MNEALVPLYVMSVFLVLMAVMVWLAVRRARRGFAWTETADRTQDLDTTARRARRGVGLDGLDEWDGPSTPGDPRHD